MTLVNATSFSDDVMKLLSEHGRCAMVVAIVSLLAVLILGPIVGSLILALIEMDQIDQIS